MATIDQLNFKVIIDDADFNEKIKQIEANAQALNASLSKTLDLQKQLGSVKSAGTASSNAAMQAATKAALAQEKLNRAQLQTQRAAAQLATEQQRTAAATSRAEAAAARAAITQERLSRAQAGTARSALTLSNAMQGAKNLLGAYFSIAGTAKLLGSLVRITSEFELQRVSLAAIIDDAQKANNIFGQIKDLAIKSPFSVLELTNYTKQLSAFSVPAEELYETVKMLADVSAGLGVGMDRLVLAYGQIRSASFLRGTEVRQLTEAGVPILEELRKKFVELGEDGITVGDVFEKISNRLVPFEMVKQVFTDMTSEGGKFYNMQEIQADTLKGKISNLKDAYQIMFSEIGDKGNGLLKGSVDMARLLAENYQKVSGAILAVIASVGAYRTALIAVRAVNTIRSIGQQVTAYKTLVLTMKALTAESKAYAAVQALIKGFNPYTAIATAVAGLAVYFGKAAIDAGKFNRELKALSAEKYNIATDSVSKFQTLVESLRSATVGSEDYRNAISRLNNQYGEYLPNLLNEKNALDEIARAEDEVVGKIMARQKLYALEEGTQKLEAKYGKNLSSYLDKFSSAISNGQDVTRDAANRFVASFRQQIESAVLNGTEIPELGKAFESYFGKAFTTGVGTALSNYVSIVNSIKELAKAKQDFEAQIEMRWGAGGYTTEAEYQAKAKIQQDFEQRNLEISKERLSKEEAEQKLLQNKLLYLERLKQAYLDLAQAGGDNAGQWYLKVSETQKEIDKLQPRKQTWLMQAVNPNVSGKGNNDLKAKEDTDYTEYVKALREEYKKVNANLVDIIKTNDAQTDEKIKSGTEAKKALWQERKRVIEAIAKSLGFTTSDLSSKEVKTSTRTGKSEQQKEIEAQIALIKQVWEWDKKLSAFENVSPDKKGLLAKYFPGAKAVIEAGNYEKVLAGLIDQLAKFDKYAAEREGRSVSGKSIDVEYGQLREQEKAIEDYKEYVKRWDEALTLEGENVNYKLSKIVARYSAAVKKAKDDMDEVMQNLADSGVDTTDKKSLAGQVYDQDVANATKEAEQAMRDLANSWVESWNKLDALDIQSLGQMTASELMKVSNVCKNFVKDDVLSSIPENIKQQVTNAGLSLEDLASSIEKEINNLKGKADNKLFDKVMKNAARTVSAVNTCISSLSELAETTGNEALQVISNMTKSLSMLQGVLQSLASGDWVSAITQVVTNAVTQIINAVNKAEKLKVSIAEAQTELSNVNFENRLSEGVDTIFGTNKLAKMKNGLKEANDAYKRAIEDAKRYQETMKGGMDDDTNGSATAIAAGAGAAIGAAIVGIFSLGIGALAGAGIGAAIGAAVGAAVDIATASNNYEKSLQDMANELGAELFDENGIYNTDTLDAILQAYDDLSAADQAFIKQAKANAEQYKKAWESVNEVMKDLFSTLQSDVASAMISSFKESGKAALDYADAIDTVASSIANMMIQGAMAEYFDENFQKEVTTLVTAGKHAEALQMTVDKLEQFNDEVGPSIQAYMEGIQDYLVMDTEGQSLSADIKGITENTASLLASYLNAIRSDVSFTKTTVSQIAQSLQVILASGTPAPTLTLYLQQINVNTQNIMLDIRAMMTNEGGATALRTYNA